MSTYRKFDKYRQRADFLSDLEFGIDTPANKWIASGTGSPVVARTANGLSLETSAGGTATTFIQRGIISAATRSTVLTPRYGYKFHAVGSFDISGLGEASVLLGFAGANADPLGQTRAILTAGPTGFEATFGTDTVSLAANLDDYAANDVLDLEVYYDGATALQFYAGRRRVLKIDVEDDEGDMNGIDTAMSPTFGLLNDGEAQVHTVVMPLFGYAVQRVENRNW